MNENQNENQPSTGVGRRADFVTAAQSHAAYRRSSVLDKSLPSGTGYAEKDRSRLLPSGDFLHTPNGVAEQTWQTRQSNYLDTPASKFSYRAFG